MLEGKCRQAAGSRRKRKSMASSCSSPPKQRNPNLSILTSLLEPWSSLFPSEKSEYIKLVAVVTIACFVAFSSNYLLVHLFNRHPLPFCDDDLDLLSLSGTNLLYPLFFNF